MCPTLILNTRICTGFRNLLWPTIIGLFSVVSKQRSLGKRIFGLLHVPILGELEFKVGPSFIV